MQCAQCGADNQADRETCSQCGSLLRGPAGPTVAQPAAVVIGGVSEQQGLAEPAASAPRAESVDPTAGRPPEYSADGAAGQPGPAPPPDPFAVPRVAPPAAWRAAEPPARTGTPVTAPERPGWQAPVAVAVAPPQRPPLPNFGSLATAPADPRAMVPCGVCGTLLPVGHGQCLRCATPRGAIVDPNDPTATVYLPFGPHVPLKPLFRAGDLSAEGTGDAVRGWSWSAALLPTLWAARHRAWGLAVASGFLTALLLALFLSRAGFHRVFDPKGTLTGFLITCTLMFAVPRSLFAGFRGLAIAWQSGRYPDEASLRKADRRWSVWAIITVSLLVLFLGLAASLLKG